MGRGLYPAFSRRRSVLRAVMRAVIMIARCDATTRRHPRRDGRRRRAEARSSTARRGRGTRAPCGTSWCAMTDARRCFSLRARGTPSARGASRSPTAPARASSTRLARRRHPHRARRLYTRPHRAVVTWRTLDGGERGFFAVSGVSAIVSCTGDGRVRLRERRHGEPAAGHPRAKRRARLCRRSPRCSAPCSVTTTAARS